MGCFDPVMLECFPPRRRDSSIRALFCHGKSVLLPSNIGQTVLTMVEFPCSDPVVSNDDPFIGRSQHRQDGVRAIALYSYLSFSYI